MKPRMPVRRCTYGAILAAALAIMIPTVLAVGCRVLFPPFSAALEVMYRLYVSNVFKLASLAALVGIGSAFGFFVTLRVGI